MMSKKLTWAFPGIVFVGAITLASACGSNGDDPLPNCPDETTTATTTTTGGGGSGGEASSSSGSGAAMPTPETPSAQEVNARLHGCRKLRYSALGSLLSDRGVDLTTFGGSSNTCQTVPGFCAANEACYCPAPPCVPVGNEAANPGTCVAAPGSPGFLFTTAPDAFSVPKADSRRGEKDGHTTASAMKLFDIFIQAAPQIIANMSDAQLAPACAINGVGINMFDPVDGSCVEEAVSCLIGSPATEDHLLLCDLILDKADDSDPVDVAKKQHIAVASLMSAAHSCE